MQKSLDVVEEIEKTKINNEASGENLNTQDVRDDADDSVSFLHAAQKSPKT